jgi:BirA family biotin operon repressor/biotin-[acetyl-CoA-carboxylase] ligase
VSVHVADWLAAVRDGVVEAEPRAGAFAQHVSVRESTSSTNDDVARAAIEGAPEGYTVIAGEQTAGRGRRGASWYSPPGHGIYLSTLLRPERWPAVRLDAASPVASLVTLMAGVAVISAIRDVGEAPVELKWPNDVMVRTARLSAFAPGASARQGGPSAGSGPPWRKLAGILAEGASDGGVIRTVVVGVGLNVWRSSAPVDVAARMITLDELWRDPVGATRASLSALVTALLVRLREGTATLAGGFAGEIREQWRRNAPTVEGTRVRWQAQGVACYGVSAGIDVSGALRVRQDGAERLVHGGDVEWTLEPHDA